jgi:ABC-2 type transport system permease protein
MVNPLHPTVVWLTWRQVFANRRAWLAILFSLAPLAIALLVRAFSPDMAKDGHAFYLVLLKEIVIGTLLPLAALVFGTTAFGGELDDGTLLYLLVKPVARWRVVLSKYVVAVLSTCLLMLPAVFLPWFVVRAPDVPIGVPAAFLWGIGLGAVLYGALFTMLGLVARHSLVLGLMYVVGFEGVLSRSIAGIKSLSIREFANAVALRMADPSLNLGAPAVSLESVRNVGGVILIGGLAMAIFKLAHFEIAEKL